MYPIIVIVTILVYSLLLTIVYIYKDFSSYEELSMIDIVIGGPVCWVLAILCLLVRTILKNKTKKEKPYKEKNDKYIKRIVKRIIDQYERKNKDLMIMLTKYKNYHTETMWDIGGWSDLQIHKAKNELLNRKFCKLMTHQNKQTRT